MNLFHHLIRKRYICTCKYRFEQYMEILPWEKFHQFFYLFWLVFFFHLSTCVNDCKVDVISFTSCITNIYSTKYSVMPRLLGLAKIQWKSLANCNLVHFHINRQFHWTKNEISYMSCFSKPSISYVFLVEDRD